MSNLTLKNRIDSYKDNSDHKLMARLPIVITINGRSFAKNTELLDKPYCSKFAECMISTMLKLCTEIEGSLFAYYHSDEIVIIARNDQSPDTLPWYDNRIQKIVSLTSAVATSHFSRCASTVDLNMVEPIFTSQAFVVPTIAEAVNTLIYKQQQNFHSSIQFACLYELLAKKHDKHTIREMLAGLSIDEKIELLREECGTNFQDYPMTFRRGAACYKVPKITGDVVKNKWMLNSDLPIFSKDQAFITNIFKNGADIFRQASIE